MRWTTEKRKAWIRTYLAMAGQVYVHRIRKGLTDVTFGVTKDHRAATAVTFNFNVRATSPIKQAPVFKQGMVPVYEIVFGVLHVNKRGDIVASRRARDKWGHTISYPGTFYSVVKAARLAAEITDTSETTSPGTYSFPVCPSINLQTRGILPPHVIDILFDRLRSRLV